MRGKRDQEQAVEIPGFEVRKTADKGTTKWIVDGAMLGDLADNAEKIQRRDWSRQQKPWVYDHRGTKITAKNSAR